MVVVNAAGAPPSQLDPEIPPQTSGIKHTLGKLDDYAIKYNKAELLESTWMNVSLKQQQ